MRRPDFEAQLREAKAQFDRDEMTAVEERRLRARLTAPPLAPFTPRRIGLAFGAVACTALTATLFLERPAPDTLGGLALLTASDDFRAELAPDQTVRVVGGSATLALRSQRTELTVVIGSSLRLEGETVRVVGGEVVVVVGRRRPDDGPARLLVSGGAIEVMGTQFIVAQQATSGTVRLVEGAIRFRAHDGREVALAPGETLAWPLPPPASQTGPVEPTPPEGPKRALPKPRLAVPGLKPIEQELATTEDLIARVSMMRARQQHVEAVHELEAALVTPLRVESRERLSFELGLLLTYQLSDPDRACAHWQQHLRQFPRGRYDRERQRIVARLGCPVDTNP